MECRFCRAWNSDDEHRCRRCGRRLHPSVARPAPESYPAATTTAAITTATAPVLQFPQPEIESPVAEPDAAPARRVTFQRTLFSEVPSVMPPPAHSRQTPPRPARTQPRPAARRASRDQQALAFGEYSPAELQSKVAAVIFCDARAASPTHRFIAAAVDMSLVLVAMGVFLASFYLGSGQLILDKQTVPIFAGTIFTLWFLFQFLFCVADGDTPGMRWTQLRLVNFDGHRPNREQRIRRLIASCVSIVAAFLGVIWALVDEESLTWHDHISKTFPTADHPA